MNEREDQHRTLIRIRFPDVDRPLVDLDVEDRWHRGDPELVDAAAPAGCGRTSERRGTTARARRAHNQGRRARSNW